MGIGIEHLQQARLLQHRGHRIVQPGPDLNDREFQRLGHMSLSLPFNLTSQSQIASGRLSWLVPAGNPPPARAGPPEQAALPKPPKVPLPHSPRPPPAPD